MNPILIMQILELALGVLKNTTTGNTQDIVADITALEQIAAAVAKQYQDSTGKPLDLSLLTYEEPIQ